VEEYGISDYWREVDTAQIYTYWVIVYYTDIQLQYTMYRIEATKEKLIMSIKKYNTCILFYFIFLPDEICFKIVSISSIFITINWPFPSNIDCLSGFRSLSTLTMYSTALPSEEIHRYSLLAISSIRFMGKVNLESVKNAVKLAV